MREITFVGGAEQVGESFDGPRLDHALLVRILHRDVAQRTGRLLLQHHAAVRAAREHQRLQHAALAHDRVAQHVVQREVLHRAHRLLAHALLDVTIAQQPDRWRHDLKHFVLGDPLAVVLFRGQIGKDLKGVEVADRRMARR